jgi:hypothetical protein
MPSRTLSVASLPPRPFTRQEITAHHEAAHAVADLVLGVRIDEVSIQANPEDGTSGHVQGFAYDFYGCSRTELRKLVKAAVVSCYAGFEAQRLVDPEADEEVSASYDHSEAFNLPMQFEVPPRGCQYCGDDVYDRWLQRQRISAANLVKEHWRQIGAVAAVLIERERLTGHEVARAFCDAGGVVHDNLWYLLEDTKAP